MKPPGIGAQVLVLGSIYQGNPFFPIIDNHAPGGVSKSDVHRRLWYIAALCALIVLWLAHCWPVSEFSASGFALARTIVRFKTFEASPA